MGNRPILVSSCARAATAAEARFRVDILSRSSWRHARVIALDADGARVVHQVAGMAWRGARFFTLAAGVHDDTEDVVLASTEGLRTRLDDELAGADLVLMVASDGDGAASAAQIGHACAARGIMTAGVVLEGSPRLHETVGALRPYARVLMVTRDEEDVAEVLLALRA